MYNKLAILSHYPTIQFPRLVIKSLNLIFVLTVAEQERAERERKGDLDQYERLDGDRNQTTESLAVKKVSIRRAFNNSCFVAPC